MIRIVGFSGSLRAGSYNSSLLAAAAALLPEGAELTIGSIRGIPLYDADLDAAEGAIEPVRILKEQIASSDALLIATPEYNHSIPGVAKNAIDWLSRPPSDIPRVFGGRPVALMGATPGRGATALAQAAWLPVLRALATRPYFERSMMVAEAGKVFDADGALTDEATRERLKKFLAGFVEMVRERKRQKAEGRRQK